MVGRDDAFPVRPGRVAGAAGGDHAAPAGGSILSHGVLAPRAAWRSQVVAHARTPDDREPAPHPPRPGVLRWAELMRRTVWFDVPACPQCSGYLRLIAPIDARAAAAVTPAAPVVGLATCRFSSPADPRCVAGPRCVRRPAGPCCTRAVATGPGMPASVEGRLRYRRHLADIAYRPTRAPFTRVPCSGCSNGVSVSVCSVRRGCIPRLREAWTFVRLGRSNGSPGSPRDIRFDEVRPGARRRANTRAAQESRVSAPERLLSSSRPRSLPEQPRGQT